VKRENRFWFGIAIVFILLLGGCVKKSPVVSPVVKGETGYALPPPGNLLTPMATYEPAPTVDSALWMDGRLHPIPKSAPPSLGVVGTIICIAAIIAGFALVYLSRLAGSMSLDGLILSAAGAAVIGVFWLFADYPWVLPLTYGICVVIAGFIGYKVYSGTMASGHLASLGKSVKGLDSPTQAKLSGAIALTAGKRSDRLHKALGLT
jgi:hypothetical protein